jgi:hypothetical protein
MKPLDSDIASRAQVYAERNSIGLIERLGYGKDGSVWATNRANRATALKVFESARPHQREVAVYRRLAAHEVIEILGHRVPQMLLVDDELLAVEMTIVHPPFILDFAGATLDQPIDFPEEALEEWHAEKKEEFGYERWRTVRTMLAKLSSMGIHLYDVNSRNIAFADV